MSTSNTNPPSMRFPFALEGKVDPEVADAIRSCYNGFVVHEQAFAALKEQLTALQAQISKINSGT